MHLIKKGMSELKENFFKYGIEFVHQLNQTNERLTEIEKYDMKIQALVTYLALTQRDLLEYENMIKMRQNELQILMALRNQKVDHRLLDLRTLAKIADEIQEQVHTLELLIPPEHLRAEDIIEIAHVNAIFHKDNTIITIRLPLIDRTPYRYYRIHPLP